MKRVLKFAKTTLIGGLVVITPVALLVMVIIEAVQLVSRVIDPIVAMLPVTTIAGINVTGIVALLCVLGLCFAAGLIALTGAGATIGGWVEARLIRLPGYKMFKAYTRAMTGSQAQQLQPALLTNPMDTQVLAFVIEEGENHCVVLVPNAPAVMAGSIQHVPKERVAKLNITLAEASQVLSEYGMGAMPYFEDDSYKSVPTVPSS